MWKDEGREYFTANHIDAMTLLQRRIVTLKEVTWAFPFYKTRALNLCWMLWSSGEIKKNNDTQVYPGPMESEFQEMSFRW